MPKVCVIEMAMYCDECGAEGILRNRPGTEWHDISNEEYELLKKYASSSRSRRNDTYLMVVRQVDPLEWKRDIAEYIKEAGEVVAREAARKKHQEDAKLAREQKKLDAKAAKEKKLLEELQQKYATGNP